MGPHRRLEVGGMAGRGRKKDGLALLRGECCSVVVLVVLKTVVTQRACEELACRAPGAGRCVCSPSACDAADVAQAERPELFSKKLEVCARVFEFRTDADAEAKEEKRQTLLELIDFVNVKKSITEAMYKETIDMVRGVPPPAAWRAPVS